MFFFWGGGGGLIIGILRYTVFFSLPAASKQVSTSPSTVKADTSVKKENKMVKKEEAATKVKTEKGKLPIVGRGLHVKSHTSTMVIQICFHTDLSFIML